MGKDAPLVVLMLYCARLIYQLATRRQDTRDKNGEIPEWQQISLVEAAREVLAAASVSY